MAYIFAIVTWHPKNLQKMQVAFRDTGYSIWQCFRELHHQELQTNRSVNEKPQVMLPTANGNNHSAVVRASTDKDIETSIATKNMRRNDVT